MVNLGVPVTATLSEKLTAIPSVSPILYVPSNKFEDIELITVGITPSITIALLALSDPDALGAGSVKTALFPDKSLIIPPFSDKAVVFI